MNGFSDRAWEELKVLLASSLLKLIVIIVAVGGACGVIGARYFWPVPDRHSPVRWHNTEDPIRASVHKMPLLAVYSVPNIKPPHTLPTLRDLGDSAQVRAVEAIGAGGTKAHVWDDVRKALNDTEEPGEKDPYLFDRVLVATVGRNDEWMPGDRMMRTEIGVVPTNFVFAAYTIAATENQSVKVSSVEATDTRKLPSDIGLAFPGLGEVKVDGLPGKENSVKATSDINLQFEQLGVDITPESLHIVRESGLGGDVVGNTRVALSMTTDPNRIFVKAAVTKEHQRPDEIVLAVTGLNLDNDPPSMDVVPLVPLPHCALKAMVLVTFIQRHISGGRQFYEESLQDVAFLKDQQLQSAVTIAGADDVSPFVWSIQIVPADGQPDNTWNGGKLHALNARTNENGVLRRLVFSDYGRAAKLAHWVRTHAAESLASTPTGSPPDKAGRYKFNYGDAEFSKGPSPQGLAVIKQTGDACDEYAPGPVQEDKKAVEAEKG